ncbi:hypothetical protein ACFFGT_26055 [Mucilaginibacter angelicae]|uniref:PH domain-containing protein n=1 Tax=Mucilaginibacter angelicae TaxID=869718 RepID=A0ABV6LE18_9SPHI
MKSKFKFWPKFFLLMCLFLGVLIVTYVLIYFDRFFAYGKPLHFLSFPYIIFNCIIFSLIGHQLNYKAHKINITGDTITRVRRFGFGLKEVYKINELTGFLTYSISGKKNANEYLYLIAGDEKVAKLSTYYHQNYQELKTLMAQHQIQNLGNERWTLWKHLSKRTI